MFRFRQFSIIDEGAALKVGTDAVLLGAAMTLKPSDRYLLDIGTGSGVIALMASQRLSAAGADAEITAIEPDEGSVDAAERNFADSPWAAAFSLRRCTLQDFCADREYDCIFSNPPYFDASLENPDERKSAARHDSGLSISDIASFAARNLAGDGRLALILPADREKAAVRTVASFGLPLHRIIRIKTVETKPCKRVIMEFERSVSQPVEESLTLLDGGRRSGAYAALTADFYL